MGNEATNLTVGSLAAWLKQEAPRILRTWEERARKDVAAAKHHKSPVLQNEISAVLDRLAELISEPAPSGAQKETAKRKLEKVSFKHGAERAHLAPYALDEVILEYHILRETIFEILEEYRDLTPAERDIVLGVIDQAANDAASEFSRALRGFERAFVVTLVHDLRSPLNSAMMGIQQILRQADPDIEKTRLAASMAYNSLRRLSGMVTDLLDASRAQAGGILSLELADMDLGELVEQIANEDGSGRLRLEKETDEPIIGRWNREGLRRVVENLLDNARKFGAPDRPITIRMSQSKADAVLAVHNEGDPIPLHDRERLFKQFSRFGESKSIGGWGIGLVVVKGMVDAHGGTIGLESEAGKGTTFEVRLPK